MRLSLRQKSRSARWQRLVELRCQNQLVSAGEKGKSGDDGAANRQDFGRDTIQDDFIEGYCSRYP